MNQKYYDYLGTFLKDYLKTSGLKGYVLGVSGGIDSAVVCNLLAKSNIDCLCLVLPINDKCVDDAILVCKQAGVRYEVVDLSETYNQFLKIENLPISNACNANLKARLRMATLYYYAQANGYLVCGTDNADEFYTGYFTKFGDGGYDINPLRYLTKGEVFEFAKYLGVDQKIIDKIPTPGLIDGVNDEDEMKVTYKELDSYLKGKEISQTSKDRIEYLHSISEHKRNLPVFPNKPE